MKQLRAHYGCPVELALEFVGRKWQTVILAHLKESPLRYSELRQRLPDISDKMLSERLRDLETLRLVAKQPTRDLASGMRYTLTDRGESLRPVLDALYRWGAGLARELPVTVGTPIFPPNQPE